MKKKLLFILVIFLLITPVSIYASTISTSYPPYLYGVGWTDSSSIKIYAENSSAYKLKTYKVFELPSSLLQNSVSVSFTPQTTGSYYFKYIFCYSSERLDMANFSRPSSNYESYNFDSTEVYTGFAYSNKGPFDLTQDSYVDDVYYYLFVQDLNVDVDLQVTSLAPKPTPTPTPTPIRTPTPSAAPSSAPSAAPSATPAATLDDYTFWTYCYDQIIKNGGTSAATAVHRFVPSSMADFSGDAVHNYVFTYPVRIPFRVEASKFKGVGYFDANYTFDFDYTVFGQESSPYPNYLVDFSSPWIESTDSLSFNATLGNKYGNAFDVVNVPLTNGTSSEFYFCFDMYVSISSNAQLTGFGDYVDIGLDNISFKVITSTQVSSSPSEDILGQIRDEQKKQDDLENERYQEEQDKIAEAEGAITDGAGKLTDTLSAWEIFTMPFKLLQDFAGAIASEGDTGLTFPSFTLMGYQLWPSYTFDLKIIAEKFPALYNALHLITGIMVVSWFIHYCWRKWHILVGDDMPEN